MSKKKYIVAMDQGTTSSRTILFDKHAKIVGIEQRSLNPIYPRPGWVEHDAMDIFSSQYATFCNLLAKKNIKPSQIEAIGISNQRETIVVWDVKEGLPVYNAIVWQCRRTTDCCYTLKKQGLEEEVVSKTGLILDPYFSALKLKWILDKVDYDRSRSKRGELLCGTIDTWLIWKLTGCGNKNPQHCTDFTNASRTMLFNIYDKCWDEELLKYFNIPINILPKVYPSSHEYGYLTIDKGCQESTCIPITGVAGDQQAALFGNVCLEQGSAKGTYGTGCFLLLNMGSNIVRPSKKLITTMACESFEEGSYGQHQYALEGSVFIAGAALQWLKNNVELLTREKYSDFLSRQVKDTAGVFFVPCFTGLGAPHWNPEARGAIFGLTRCTTSEHIIRATLEAIAYSTRDVLEEMRKSSGGRGLNDILKVAGGVTDNDFLMQFLADAVGMKIRRSACKERSALGAAFLAGLKSNFWNNMEHIKRLEPYVDELHVKGRHAKRKPLYCLFEHDPNQKEKHDELYEGWKRAVDHVCSYAKAEKS